MLRFRYEMPVDQHYLLLALALKVGFVEEAYDGNFAVWEDVAPNFFAFFI